MNLIDGMDALAAGIVSIAAFSFAVLAASFGRMTAAALAAIVCGATLGFLWHNFHPASIFMGDTGANLLGLLLAVVAIQGVLKTAAVVALYATQARPLYSRPRRQRGGAQAGDTGSRS